MAALLTVVNPGALHPLAVETRDAIHCCSIQNKSVSLFWIKAHAGLEGNERADSLAKEAALKSKRKPDYDMYPVSFVKRFIRMDTLDEWNRRYSTGHTASTTKLFFPSAVEAYRTVRKLSITKELTQALTGHGGFSEYLTRFKCKENPACACDPGVSETVPHLLVECPIYESVTPAPRLQDFLVEATPRSWEPQDSNPKPVKRNSTIPRIHKKNVAIIKEVCEKFKEGTINFELNKMADVWQTAYYKLPEKVQCFKIHIKKLTDKEKKENAMRYGNFSGAINWNKCNLEIKAATEIHRRHFLQGDSENEGVLDNIIIVEESYTGAQKIQEESADQWLVAHNMLLMRDCETGGVVVFSKVPHLSKQAEIEDALKDFSEEYMNGKMACDDEEISNRSFDSDDDVEL
ncbi:uncharacterized protein LOC126370417 [Pectinophora gossypiella]|uniref:uncharacterized protein LOC126370417 n=1 Tax=Pectinophora gossypiella TaxID=13191 RepID=UPI00214EDC78|nr:uncharacterized protein LOC126370417 [Pectinophora gossypiella]